MDRRDALKALLGLSAATVATSEVPPVVAAKQAIVVQAPVLTHEEALRAIHDTIIAEMKRAGMRLPR